jgi:hypothetical protein
MSSRIAALDVERDVVAVRTDRRVARAVARAGRRAPHVADDGAGHDGRRGGNAQACLAPPDADGNGSHAYANLATSAQHTTDFGRDILEPAANCAARISKLGAQGRLISRDLAQRCGNNLGEKSATGAELLKVHRALVRPSGNRRAAFSVGLAERRYPDGAGQLILGPFPH